MLSRYAPASVQGRGDSFDSADLAAAGAVNASRSEILRVRTKNPDGAEGHVRPLDSRSSFAALLC